MKHLLARFVNLFAVLSVIVCICVGLDISHVDGNAKVCCVHNCKVVLVNRMSFTLNAYTYVQQ